MNLPQRSLGDVGRNLVRSQLHVGGFTPQKQQLSDFEEKFNDAQERWLRQHPPECSGHEQDYIASIDLGQASDHCALAIYRRDWPFLPYVDRPWQRSPPRCRRYACLGLRRWPLQTSYEDIGDYLCECVEKRPNLRGMELVVDAGGNRPFIDSLRRKLIILKTRIGTQERLLRLCPVQITGGGGFRQDPTSGYWNVAKVLIVNTYQALQQQKRVMHQSSDPLTRVLVEELRAFRYKLSKDTGNQQMEGAQGVHDDLVMAACLGVWWGEKDLRRPRFIR